MKTYVFHSVLPPEEVTDRLRKRMRPWSRLDGVTARNTWFLQERKEGVFRLILTGRGRSYVFTDLSLSKTESGTDITALMGIPKALQTVNIAVAALLILMALLHVCLTGSLLGALEPLVRYGWILPVMVWAGNITNRQMPELSKFIENNLLK